MAKLTLRLERKNSYVDYKEVEFSTIDELRTQMMNFEYLCCLEGVDVRAVYQRAEELLEAEAKRKTLIRPCWDKW